jgi:hypothetical protein
MLYDKTLLTKPVNHPIWKSAYPAKTAQIFPALSICKGPLKQKPNVYCSTIHNSQVMETAKMPHY